MWSKIVLITKHVAVITKAWSLQCLMIDGVKISTMKNVVVVIRNVVVTNLLSTTTCCSYIEKLTTGNIMWSLIVLTMELLMTMDDHNFVVVNNY